MTEEKRSPALEMSANTKGREYTEEVNNDDKTNVQSIIASSDKIKTAGDSIHSIEWEIVSHLPELYRRSALYLQSIGRIKINGCDEDADAQ